jgi:succinylarginine dihydrolase
MPTREFNFDGIVGPTHNYSGLSYGNVASATHKNLPSNPRAAALQGLEKMRRLHALGIGQAVLPPLRRPRLDFLREVGFSGTDRQIIDRAAKSDPVLLSAAYSASSMWTANAATVSPSPDCSDGRLHLTAANLISNLHRSLEPESTYRVLKCVFGDEAQFAVHPPLPSAHAFCDEGAANHTRLCREFGEPGIEVFVFGRSALKAEATAPRRFPARQTMEAAQAIARVHLLDPSRAIFFQQNPAAIDAGVFHNDVISVGNQNVLLCHELAFAEQANALDRLQQAFADQCSGRLHVIQIAARDLSLESAVKSYLFNSQLLTRPDGRMCLICPVECNEDPAAFACIQQILSADNPIDQVEFFDLRQSMRNGGGPACLRLRVVLTDAQRSALHPGILFGETLFSQLVDWVKRHYRDKLTPADLADPRFMAEVNAAFDELGQMLQLAAGTL